ncbi:MAG: trimethylamine methyltransferase family protein, partial [Clostridiales bacterium]
LAGCNIIYGMGMVEMGMAMSYDQLVIDAEIVRMNRRVEQGIPVDADTLAVELINQIGPGGNYLAEEHTIRYMRQESSTTKLLDRRMMDSWREAGATDLAQRAHTKAMDIIENFNVAPLPQDVNETIDNIIAAAEADAK